MRHFRELEEKSPGSLVFVSLRFPSSKDIFVFVGASEEGTGVRTNGDDLAVVGSSKFHTRKNHLARNTASLIALKDARVVNDHPLQGRALVCHLSNLHTV